MEIRKMTDEQLVEGCLKNDPIAQKQLYDTFSKKMMGLCLRYADNIDDAQDFLQDGFIKVFEKMDTYRGSGSFEGWIRKIMVNNILNTFRKTKKLKQNIAIDDVSYMLHDKSSTMDAVTTKDLLKMIQQLPTGFRTVFNLYAIEGYSHKEIADELGITESTSKSQYSRARAYLQKLIKLEKAL